MAGRRSRSDARPSIHSVAAYAGVSTATVSKVMHGDPTIRPENVKSVQNAIEALGYRINPLAAELRRGRRKVIGAIVPNYDDPFLSAMMNTLELQAESRGYGFTAMSSRNSEAREIELIGRMEDWRVSGVIVIPVKAGRGAAALLREAEIATAFIDRIGGDSGFDTVSPDWPAALDRLARDVVGFGHRDVLVLSPALVSGETAPQAVRLRDAFSRQDAAVRVEVLNCKGENRLAGRMRAAFGRKARPTIVLSFVEAATMLALNEARFRGWKVPADLSLFALQPAPWMHHHEPPIGVLEQPIGPIAERAVEFLFRRIEKSVAPPLRSLEACMIDYRSSLARAGSTAESRPKSIVALP